MKTEIDSRAIDAIVSRHEEIRTFLDEHNEISLRDYTDFEFRKVLVLSVASFFEQQITEAVARLAASTNSQLVENLVRNKAIHRQYHTYFQWRSPNKNANQFLGLFGNDFKEKVAAEIRQDPTLDEGCKSFLRLGEERNRLVHGNFATVPLDNTLQEIKDSYSKALEFVEYLSNRIQPQIKEQ